MALLGYFQYRLFFHDDAYISLRYWLNFSNGQGLVWNPGETVEGYTNFLFLALTGLISEIGIGLPQAARGEPRPRAGAVRARDGRETCKSTRA